MSEKIRPQIDETPRPGHRTGRRTRRLRVVPSGGPRTMLVLVVALALLVATVGPSTAGAASKRKRDFCTTMRPELRALVKDLKAPGAVVLVRSPKIDCFLSFGSRTLDGRTRIGPDDQFRIGSNTKTMTGTVILQLVQEGKLSLSDPVSKHHIGVPNGDNITITQLLNMRSGLQDFTGLPAFGRTLDAAPQRVWTHDEVLALSYEQAPAFAPGQGYLYANPNTVLLGLIAEQVTGQPLAKLFEKRIYRPLGLSRTLLPAANSHTIPKAHARGYMYGSIEEFITGPLSPEQQAAAEAGTLKPIDRTDMNPSWGWAAGGAISTTNDLARYVKALGGGAFLNRQMQAQRLASPLPIDPSTPDGPASGLGIVKYGELYGHTGELPGYDSFIGYDPKRDLTLVTWSNLLNSPDGRSTGGALATAVIDKLYPK